MFRWLLIILVLVAAIAGLAIGALNADRVVLDLALTRFSLPLGALVLIALVIGLLLGLVLAWAAFIIPARFRRRSGSRPGDREQSLADRRNA